MKFTTEKFNIVDSEEFSRAVTKHFGKKYDFQLEEGADDDTDHIFSVDDAEFGVWDWMKYGIVTPSAGAMLGALFNAGKIPAGKYIISVRN